MRRSGTEMDAKIDKMAPKIDPKSMTNRGCIADAIFECPWAPKVLQLSRARSLLVPLGWF